MSGDQARWYEQGGGGPPDRYGETRIGGPGPQPAGAPPAWPQTPGPPQPGPPYTGPPQNGPVQPGSPPYGPAQYGPPQWGAGPASYGPPPVATPARAPTVVAAVLLLVAAALAIGGTFAPFSTYGFSDTNSTIYTGWAVTYEPPDPEYGSLGDLSGIPITVGAALSVLAAILLVAARRPAPVARLVGVTGAAVLVGAVATVLLNLVTTAHNVGVSDSLSSDISTTFVIGPGAWIVLAGAGVALIALAVLVARPSPR